MEFFLIATHIVGTILGVGSATMVESHLSEALKDKLISDDEKQILKIDYKYARIGLILILLSGFGLLLLDKFEGTTVYLYSPRLWAKMLMVVLIGINILLLEAHKISLYWGSAISFASWWTAAFIGMFITHNLRFDFFGTGRFLTTFASLMVIYVTAVVVFAALLHIIRTTRSATTS